MTFQESLDFRESVVAPWETPSRTLTRGEWLAECEAATKRVREIRAGEYERAGERTLSWFECDGLEGIDERQEAFAQLINAGARSVLHDDYWTLGPSTLPLPIPKWHADRAAAQRERWSKLNTCGGRRMVRKCGCGGVNKETVLRCDHWRLCIECRGRRKARYQARFTLGRKRILRRLAPLMRRFGSRAEGRWSEKMLTLTIPHSGSASADVRALVDAWPRLRARIARYVWRRSGKRVKWSTVPYWRSLEVTASDAGHAHYHLWLVLPYVPQRLLAHWWALSLPEEYRSKCPRVPLYVMATDERDRRECSRAARGATWLYRSVVDMRAADERARGEIVKYIVKDCVGDPSEGHFIEPQAFAPIYGALDGARVVATSTRFIERQEADACFCEHCGEYPEKTFEDVPLDYVEGPPPD